MTAPLRESGLSAKDPLAQTSRSELDEGVAQADQEHGGDEKIIEYGVHGLARMSC